MPAEPTHVQKVKSFKRNVYPNVSPLLGLNPTPKRNVITLQLTAAPDVYYLGVEKEVGWEIIAHLDTSTSASGTTSASRENPEEVAKRPAFGLEMKEALNTSVEWANTYYHGESVALIN